ncbi:cupin domain-containing protein [Iamia sp. SCSIO 61187]|uniref:cupin domain-containing protein n=1 Tax=Iamia sp. SCSIO 61187 TaxID=2722752 RepID=UPI001C6333D4|nr:cupin domain-containing protein [Iamia sp. SCSIO 61187]QYG95001.1 cupin domain-containing protein [Iamia sp. SCSIO 61187]
MAVIPAGERRVTTTPNATMTTCCSPEQGAAGITLWLTAMAPGAQGPWHRLDGEQVLTVLAGAVSLEHAGTTVRLLPGDTAVIPAHDERRLTADAEGGTEMACAATRPLRAHDGEGTDRGIPDWMR